MTTVLVVDDAPLFQAGISAALDNAGFEIVGQAQDAMTAVSKTRQLQPDVVILDVLMPGLSGLEVLDKIVGSSPKTRVVLLTASESEEDLLAAIKAGASGYVVKDTPLPQLVSNIRDVVAGGSVVSETVRSDAATVLPMSCRHQAFGSFCPTTCA